MSGPLQAVLEALRDGEPAIIPTDTVYGLAADPRIPGATAKLFALKGRPDEKALPILGASIESLRTVASFDRRAESLADRFWPGPLTLVLPRFPGCDWELGGSEASTVAVRVPAHPLALELLQAHGPLAVTSANRSGEPPATTAQMARDSFGTPVAALDGGPARIGAASSVVALVGEPLLLRAGEISLEDLGV